MVPQRPIVDVMIPSNPMAAMDLLAGIDDYNRRFTCHWRLSAWTAGAQSTLVRRLRITRADAAMVFVQDRSEVRALRRWNRPVVNLLEYKTPGLACVALDDVEVGKMGADHLISIGCDQLAFVVAPHRFAIEREQGFLQRAKEVGRSTHLLRITEGGTERYPDWAELADPALLARWVGSLPKPIGIMACNDAEARRVIDACEEMDVRVPEEVAVIGVDNNLVACQYSPTTVTSIDPGYAPLGFRAAEALHMRMRNPDLPETALMLPPLGVITRRSTDVLAFRDPDVREAVRIIRDRAGISSLTVDEVVNTLSISRRSLERKFQDAIGRTPGDEIRRVRMARARRLVVETDLKMSEIATMTGFEYLPHFTTAFKREHGNSPTAYRAEHRPRRLAVPNAMRSA